MAKILVIDDDINLCDVVQDHLAGEHYKVDLAHSCADGQEFLRQFTYDLILLDWTLPDGAGVDLCLKLRTQGLLTPILMLTGKGEIHERATGLDSGADDYLVKPFDCMELSARLRALLRRTVSHGTNTLANGAIRLDMNSHEVTKNGEVIKMAPLDFALLEFFMRNPGKSFTLEQLLDRVWEAEAGAGPESVRGAVRRLRKFIDNENEPSLIETVFGVGYKMLKRESI